jgi:type III secretory pathway component EscS
MTDHSYDILVLAVRALFLIATPITGALALGGVLVSLFQAATTIDEPAMGHAVRVLALGIVFYALFSFFSETMVSLAKAAFGG